MPLLNIDRLKFRQLALILALEESHNLHRAAERIGLSQPAATKLLKEIETTLRVTLFDRQPRGMVPTIYGLAVAHHATHVLNDVCRHITEFADDSSSTSPSSRLSCGPHGVSQNHRD